jgi:hypothetical protein
MARGPILTRSKAWMEMMRAHYANYGRQSRSVASNVFPHLNTNPMNRAANPRPQSTAAARLYPHLASRAQARKPRMTRGRRIYGDLE